MKKMLLGIFIGAMLIIPCVSFADGAASVIGKKIDGLLNVKVNTRDTHASAVVIDGTGYISIRDAAKLWGYDVFYDDTNKEVDLIQKDYDPNTKGNTIDIQTITK